VSAGLGVATGRTGRPGALLCAVPGRRRGRAQLIDARRNHEAGPPDRETGDQADWIFFKLRKFPQRPWLVPARPQPRSLAGLTVDPGTDLNFALVPYHPAEQARGST
jgi:hypothetical protein